MAKSRCACGHVMNGGMSKSHMSELQGELFVLFINFERLEEKEEVSLDQLYKGKGNTGKGYNKFHLRMD